MLGRLLLTGSPAAGTAIGAEVLSPIALRRMVIRWMAPLLVGMPLASSDLYSYAAQAQLARHGLDPYTTTPADLPAVDLGKFLDNVAWKWVDTPSPYGPLWVAVSKWVAAAHRQPRADQRAAAAAAALRRGACSPRGCCRCWPSSTASGPTWRCGSRWPTR